jgi:glycosyltransferase involved in cell wall biosynthesis
MPAHNTAPYVAIAIASALAQSMSDLELIAIDDGSHDGTRDIIEDWRRRDARVRVFANDRPAGSSAARNTGLEAARGRYVAFLDSDDEWLPAYVETQLSAFDQFPDAAVVTGNAISVGGPLDGRPLRSPSHPRRRLSLLDMIEHEDAVNIMSVFRRDVFETIGGFDVSLRRSEDYDFWLRAAAAGFVFVQTPEPLVRYRRRADGLSADELKMHAGIVTTLTRARGLCANRPAETAAIDRQIARFDRDAIAIRAKAALRARAFDDAARLFHQLYERDGRMASALLATASRVAPRALWLADRARSATRRTSQARPLATASSR